MTATLAGAGAGLAWLGAAILVLSDGTRGLAFGLALSGVGLAAAVATLSGSATAAIAAGAVLAALLRLRGGAGGWGLLPPGSTPRLILAMVIGAAALYLGVLVAGAGGPAAPVAALAAAGLATSRLLGCERRQDALACASLAALGLGGLEIASQAGGAAEAALLAAVVAVAVALPSNGRPVAA